MEFYGKSFPEAVQLLTGESGEGQTEASTAPPTAFHLPLHNRTADRAIQYLTESRGLNKTLVEAFLLSGIFTRTQSGTMLCLSAETEAVRRDTPMCEERQTHSGRTLPGLTSPIRSAMRETATSSLSLKHRLTCYHSSAFIRRTGRKKLSCPGRRFGQSS